MSTNHYLTKSYTHIHTHTHTLQKLFKFLIGPKQIRQGLCLTNPNESQSPRASAKLLCSGAIIKGSVDFVVKCLWLVTEWQALMWTLMQSDMCNRSQDLITSVAIKTNSDRDISHSRSPWALAAQLDVNSQCQHQWKSTALHFYAAWVMIDTVNTYHGNTLF